MNIFSRVLEEFNPAILPFFSQKFNIRISELKQITLTKMCQKLGSWGCLCWLMYEIGHSSRWPGLRWNYIIRVKTRAGSCMGYEIPKQTMIFVDNHWNHSSSLRDSFDFSFSADAYTYFSMNRRTNNYNCDSDPWLYRHTLPQP